MKKLLAVMLVLVIALAAVGCSGRAEISRDDIVDKTYVYEGDGFGGDFTIEIKADGTFDYYEGFFSSHIGLGEWTYADGTLTLLEEVSRFVGTNEAGKNEMEQVVYSYVFSVRENTLIFVAEDSDNFRYLTVSDGEKFIARRSDEK